MILVAAYTPRTGGLSVSANPPFSSTTVYKDAGFTPSTTLTVTGGSGTYTYAWVISDDAGGFIDSVTNPTSASTTFIYVSMESGIVANGQATCTITDTVSGAVTVFDYYIQLLRF